VQNRFGQGSRRIPVLASSCIGEGVNSHHVWTQCPCGVAGWHVSRRTDACPRATAPRIPCHADQLGHELSCTSLRRSSVD